MKVVIFNVKYSPNLGDGLLSECLEHALRRAQPGMIVESADLAGRTNYGAGSGFRGGAMAFLEALPAPLRRVAARIALGGLIRYRLRAFLNAAVQDCDAVVVGGGNLFADKDLNFPMKVAAALSAPAARNLPVAVYGVGATRNWTPTGQRMFANALGKVNLADATLRDDRSVAVWNDLLVPQGIRRASLAFDPGLLTSRFFPSAKNRQTGRRIALCVTDPVALRYHGGGDTVGSYIGNWYRGVTGSLVAAGYDVLLFTNGSPEDRAYLAEHGEAWVGFARGQGNTSTTIVPGFDNPAGLVDFLSGCDLVMAHRMHACIAAHSFAIPTIGLSWDVKLNSFFEIAGRSRYMIDPATVDPDSIAALVGQALADGIDPIAHAALLDQSERDVARMASLLVAASSAQA